MTEWAYPQMDEYKITEEKLKAISEKFEISLGTVRRIQNVFLGVLTDVKNQYLAHIIRCMETYLRKRTKNKMFQINCYALDPKSPLINVGCAQYHPKKCFSIFFHPRMDEIQLRVCLAHELGHLFFVEMLNDLAEENEEPYDAKTLTEPISSILGIFTIMDKNDFYQDYCRKLNHRKWENIIEDFLLLKNRLIN